MAAQNNIFAKHPVPVSYIFFYLHEVIFKSTIHNHATDLQDFHEKFRVNL